ncbi:NADH:flavin oxidoreductase/NADH oxidase [Plectosphaerella plurivora]|uniref:NADH:flavin oxidoreductase/NADH oxidase n=1 Tax=Plectosphaerella plurivora TaxID=936078 RepID=A0A9P9A9N4_9PEZI|nr:NADH:flavin oxidoreductase/NADH oxidase [Plectosphaerella plurivora]
MSNTANKPAPGVSFYTPAQQPPAGTPVDAASAPTLFTPLRIRDVELTNRFIVSPMCQYSADQGHLTDWHLVHLGQFAVSGAALTIVEATAVEARGRISPEDSGLWQDSQIAPLKRIVEFIHSQGQKAGIQLGHAGRKASNLAPWLSEPGQRVHATAEEGGWPDDVVGPSAIPFAEGWYKPKALTVAEIKALVEAFAESARRAVEAGFDVIEIHGAHGYLLTEFMSPLSNTRTDDYGGSFENRIRLLLEVIKAIRAVIPEGMPLFVRISATEWMEHSVDASATEQTWDLEQSIRLAKLLPALGVDLLDVSSGGNNSAQKIELHKYYQVSLAGQIREALLKDGKQLLIGAVGMISEAEMARSIVQGADGAARPKTVEIDEEHGQKTQADAVLVAREFLRDPHFVLNVAKELNVPIKWPHQYERAPRKTHGKL